jgi:hypothetical protein
MLAVDLRSKQPTPAGTGPTDFFAVPRTDRDPDPMGNPGDVRVERNRFRGHRLSGEFVNVPIA